MRQYLPLLCLVMLHSPDGSVVSINTSHIVAVRPSTEAIGQYVAPGTNTIVYLTGQKIGVRESQEVVETYIKECGDE